MNLEALLTVTNVIIAINVIVFLMVQNNPQLLNRMIFDIGEMRYHKQYDRLLLAGFLHHNLIHLVFNMITLYYFGNGLESTYLGHGMYLLLYIFSIVSGNLFCLFMKKEDPGYAALGASGGIFGLIFSSILFFPRMDLYFFFIPFGIPGWILGICLTLISILLTQSSKARAALISHEGHLGGGLAGGLLTIAFYSWTLLDPLALYFALCGLAPIILFLIIKWVRPDLLYRR